jgi:hypothetical protein
MASDYAKVYQTILRQRTAPQIQRSAVASSSASAATRGFDVSSARSGRLVNRVIHAVND